MERKNAKNQRETGSRSVMANFQRQSWKVLVLLFLGTIVVAAITITPWVREFANRARTVACLNHIQVALWCYHERYGCYPPQYLADEAGNPAHSWRVLLLPDLGYGELYRRYRFDEPWDGPNNRLLVTAMPAEYRSPFLDSKSTISQYIGIAGKNTAWRGTISLHMEDMRPSEQPTLIFLVEAANSDIQWMEPRDIPVKQALVGINVPGGRGIQSNYTDGLPAQMESSGIEMVPVDISLRVFRSMLTVAGERAGR